MDWRTGVRIRMAVHSNERRCVDLSAGFARRYAENCIQSRKLIAVSNPHFQLSSNAICFLALLPYTRRPHLVDHTLPTTRCRPHLALARRPSDANITLISSVTLAALVWMAFATKGKVNFHYGYYYRHTIR
jgi:hypothetical protein